MTSWYRDFDSNNDSGDNGNGNTGETPARFPSRRPNHRFDFEIGYLIKSPCRNCDRREDFPGCDEACDILEKIHSALCDSVSCTKHG